MKGWFWRVHPIEHRVVGRFWIWVMLVKGEVFLMRRAVPNFDSLKEGGLVFV